MKGITGFVVAAVVLGAAGAACLGASRLDDELARAEEAFLTSDYATADDALRIAERYYQYAQYVPGIGERPANDIHARQAALAYWRRDYAALAPADRTDPVSDVAADNIHLQLIVADAVYRNGQRQVKDRATTLRMLEAAIAAYRTVLGNARLADDAPYAEAAAYNYEYVIRLRDELLKGRRRTLPPPAEDEGNLGFEGGLEGGEFEQEFKLYVPLEKEERENTAPGQSPPVQRKG
jgi:hypothetical protein